MVFRYHSKEDLEYHFWGKSRVNGGAIEKEGLGSQLAQIQDLAR